MEKLVPLLITALLFLIPLAPATFLYKLLTPTRSRNGGATKAQGEAGVGDLRIAGVKIKFNVVGSTATYIVLLVLCLVVHERISGEADKRISLEGQQAWRVEIPVLLKDENEKDIPAYNGELQQVRVKLEPQTTQASANMIRFWVVPDGGRFPSATFSLEALSQKPEVLDLNDQSRLIFDYSARRIVGVGPVWIKLGEKYSK